MSWEQVFTIIGSLGGLMAILIYLVSRLENHMTKIEGRMNSHDARIDTAYNMFYDLLKEMRK